MNLDPQPAGRPGSAPTRSDPPGCADDELVREAALVARLRRGDAVAYELLVRDAGGRMLAAARRLLPNEEDARDVLQDAFVAVFKSIDRFEGSSRLATWLHRIVVNSALMKLRSQRSRPERSIEELLPAFQEDGHHVEPPTPWRDAAPEQLLAKERAALVREAIGQLPDTHREVLLLRDLEQLSTEETARTLGITGNAVKIRLHRARQALRTLLDRHFRGSTP